MRRLTSPLDHISYQPARICFNAVLIDSLVTLLFHTSVLHIAKMHFSRSPKLFGLAVFASSVSAGVLHPVIKQRDPNSVCQTFGIDYQDGGSYFINQNSTEQFTAVSQFEGKF